MNRESALFVRPAMPITTATTPSAKAMTPAILKLSLNAPSWNAFCEEPKPPNVTDIQGRNTPAAIRAPATMDSHAPAGSLDDVFDCVAMSASPVASERAPRRAGLRRVSRLGPAFSHWLDA